MPVVAAGPLMGIDVSRWDPFGKAVSGDVDLPVGMVGGVVVRGADQHEVAEGGWPSIGPVHRMMHIAPLRWNVAGGEGTSAVAEDYGAAEWAGDGAVGPADVQRLTLTTEHCRDYLGVACDTRSHVVSEIVEEVRRMSKT